VLRSVEGCRFSMSVRHGVIGLFPFSSLVDQRSMVVRIRKKKQSRIGQKPRPESNSRCMPCSTSDSIPSLYSSLLSKPKRASDRRTRSAPAARRLHPEGTQAPDDSSGSSLLGLLSRIWPGWKESLVIVQPDTVVRIAAMDPLDVPAVGFRFLYAWFVIGHAGGGSVASE
jgi:hypothetical protein